MATRENGIFSGALWRLKEIEQSLPGLWFIKIDQ
jgi:hypothetical protein